MTRISVVRIEERECGCKRCMGHETKTRQIINPEVEGLADDLIDKMVKDRFPDDDVLSWRVWSEAEYMRSIRAKELPLALQAQP